MCLIVGTVVTVMTVDTFYIVEKLLIDTMGQLKRKRDGGGARKRISYRHHSNDECECFCPILHKSYDRRRVHLHPPGASSR